MNKKSIKNIFSHDFLLKDYKKALISGIANFYNSNDKEFTAINKTIRPIPIPINDNLN